MLVVLKATNNTKTTSNKNIPSPRARAHVLCVCVCVCVCVCEVNESRKSHNQTLRGAAVPQRSNLQGTTLQQLPGRKDSDPSTPGNTLRGARNTLNDNTPPRNFYFLSRDARSLALTQTHTQPTTVQPKVRHLADDFTAPVTRVVPLSAKRLLHTAPYRSSDSLSLPRPPRRKITLEKWKEPPSLAQSQILRTRYLGPPPLRHCRRRRRLPG